MWQQSQMFVSDNPQVIRVIRATTLPILNEWQSSKEDLICSVQCKHSQADYETANHV